MSMAVSQTAAVDLNSNRGPSGHWVELCVPQHVTKERDVLVRCLWTEPENGQDLSMFGRSRKRALGDLFLLCSATTYLANIADSRKKKWPNIAEKPRILTKNVCHFQVEVLWRLAIPVFRANPTNVLDLRRHRPCQLQLLVGVHEHVGAAAKELVHGGKRGPVEAGKCGVPKYIINFFVNNKINVNKNFKFNFFIIGK
jgi:hypothetical protein